MEPKVRVFLLLAAASTLLVGLPVEANIDGSVSGVYRFVGGASERDRIQKQRETAVELFNALLRPVARRALQKACLIPERVVVDYDEQALGVRLEPLPMRTSSLDGNPLHYLNYEGDEIVMSRRLQGDAVVEVSHRGRSSRTLVYRFSGSRLRIRWTVASNLLPRPVIYDLSYSR